MVTITDLISGFGAFAHDGRGGVHPDHLPPRLHPRRIEIDDIQLNAPAARREATQPRSCLPCSMDTPVVGRLLDSGASTGGGGREGRRHAAAGSIIRPES